ncbi:MULTISPECIES: hypothetical protein [unclassified Oceanispirochaeta]|uniref:hypothetical protein n=1 Tax=unclassified Oceanispirochaeta TaxID=2635722 RepID=UPI000E08E430|nr:MULTISPECIES: hypothetical protein [unclassified Oceanispirochaeta]MBF9017818.1 hypothetical protein [Oceanispirochaeta sp. M2]NPD74278.1 hypothetical protein [Oceanispirochaeta sp. M1]RDG29868.1 hypothetical protein DV872_19445 [Oceanispirochaeta sp. M1]
MSDIDPKIEELRNDMNENLGQRESVWQELGRFLLNEGESESESGLMQEYRSAALEIDSRISLMDHQVQEIDEAVKTLDTLKDQDEDLKERRSKVQSNLTLLQETLGEDLFHLMNSQDLDVPWKKAFDPLVKSISKIRDNETELFQVESSAGEKNILKGLVQRSRMTLLKNKKKSMESSQTKLFQKCFTDALLMGAGKGDASSKDADLLAPWFRADKEWQALVADEEKADNERTVLKERLKELCGARGAKKRIEFLDKEIVVERERLDEALRKWGESVTGDTPEKLLSLPEVKDAVAKIDLLTESAIQINVSIEKWEARKDIEKLSTDREYMEHKIETLEEEILARKQEIKILKKEITTTQKEIDKKKSFAGEE